MLTITFATKLRSKFSWFKTPLEPSLKLSTADATPVSKVARLTNTSLGHFFQMTPLSD